MYNLSFGEWRAGFDGADFIPCISERRTLGYEKGGINFV